MTELNSLYLLQYAEKVFICRTDENPAQQILKSIFANDKKAVYQHIVKSDMDINTISRQAFSGMSSFPIISNPEKFVLKSQEVLKE